MKKLVVKICTATFLFSLFLFCSEFGAQAEINIGASYDLQAGPGYDFKKTEWGMSPEEVKSSENSAMINEQVKSEQNPNITNILYNANYFGVPGVLGYRFDSDKLVAAIFVFLQPIDIYQDLIRRSERSLGPYSFVGESKEENEVYLIWNVDWADVALISYPMDTEKEEYKYRLEFYNPELNQFDFVEAIDPSGYFEQFQAGPEYNFRKTRWLMTIGEVLQTEQKKPIERGLLNLEKMQAYYIAYPQENILGYPAIYGYGFIDGDLAPKNWSTFKVSARWSDGG